MKQDPDRVPSPALPEPLFVDDQLLVLLKPAGLLAVPGRGAEGADNLWSRVLGSYPDARVVHRLDQATSGLLVMARSPASQRALSAQFAQRLVDKSYEAVVEGLLERDAGLIELPLMADWPRRPMQKVDHAAGKPSRTAWQVLMRDRNAGATRLALTPQTGRTHQLRVHLAAIGHPIVGDRLYGGAAKLAARLMLHATELGFRHPVSGEPLRFSSAAPF